MNQHMRITSYIMRYGSITTMEAYDDLGITKLATRISEMRQLGMPIVDIFETGKNRFGEPVRYKRYFFGGNDD